MILTFNKSKIYNLLTKVYYLAKTKKNLILKQNIWHINFLNEIMFNLLL